MPSVEGFSTYLYSVVGVPASALDPTSPLIQLMYQLGLDMTPVEIQQFSQSMYDLTVYNLATSYTLNMAPDTADSTWFSEQREKYGTLSSFPGVITTAGDDGTTASITVPDFVKNMSLQELQWMRDPWGRQALMILQQLSYLWGLS